MPETKAYRERHRFSVDYRWAMARLRSSGERKPDATLQGRSESGQRRQ